MIISWHIDTNCKQIETYPLSMHIRPAWYQSMLDYYYLFRPDQVDLPRLFQKSMQVGGHFSFFITQIYYIKYAKCYKKSWHTI